ncbi:conserved hypothetical protein [Neospora caninum Liverpool]|uniref:COPI associated protein n=1 Tax=Neospora caninum (strain Liverpool) TaxID=572307 RepID=F0VBR7_NEOCL|nr:conserved hypothetical protein [Neospora caninum Liverpool]CBZ51051.1 conserved hypothetical protein [Neospora caninum Liverpool]CEL68357.1 TPA: hypothetical protein BN1204_041260 [Neospora caninum Liverpool]|eukprot:XP_003881084.1 conserved hypothetical protein [Neospora caninum Liverpool]
MDETFWERIPLLVRVFTAGSAFALCCAGVINVALPVCYTTCILGLALIGFGIVALLCEFSPYGLNVLMGVCPLLGEYFFRGVIYLLVGLLPLGKEMSWFGRLAGSLMILSGAANIAVHIALPAAVYYGPANGGERPGHPDDEEQPPYAADECPSAPSHYDGLH